MSGCWGRAVEVQLRWPAADGHVERRGTCVSAGTMCGGHAHEVPEAIRAIVACGGFSARYGIVSGGWLRRTIASLRCPLSKEVGPSGCPGLSGLGRVSYRSARPNKEGTPVCMSESRARAGLLVTVYCIQQVMVRFRRLSTSRSQFATSKERTMHLPIHQA